MIIRADTATPQYETGARSPTALTYSRAPGSEPARAGLLEQRIGDCSSKVVSASMCLKI